MSDTDEPTLQTAPRIPKTALVTGGSAGLGAAICEQLAARGWTVYAASRRGTLAVGADPRLRTLKADVTDPDAMATAISVVVRNQARIDALICNAGIHVSAPAEELPLTSAEAILATNFWGVAHGARAALPQMRSQGAGTIVVVGSLAGMVSPPGAAYYAASKHAVRGFLESLQYEVSGFGIRVHLVEPGFIKTSLASSSPPSEGAISAYDALRGQLEKYWREAVATGMSAQTAAARIVRIVEDENASFRTRVGPQAVWVPPLKAMLPARTFFAIARRRFGLPRA